MKWLKNAIHYLKLIFKKSSLDNVILDYFINEVINSDFINDIAENTKINKHKIIEILVEIQEFYNREF